MYISKLKIRNWRNFRTAEIELAETSYLLGPNASGKSNLLDLFRFLRDIVNPNGGGFQQAVKSRGGLSKLRCLAARQNPTVDIEVEFRDSLSFREGPPNWCYKLSFSTEPSGKKRPQVKAESAYKNGELIFTRPDEDDKNDQERLTRTLLETINSNKKFREIPQFFERTLYLHLVPQLLKHSELFVSRETESDPFGQGFLKEIAGTAFKIRESRLRRTEKILKKVIPHFEELKFSQDPDTGYPHLEMRYVHWRPNAGWQREDQFSDGTLRLIALVWTLMASDNLILLEEPELSLHRKIVEQIPRMIADARRSRKIAGGQIIVSTHSPDLLSDNSMEGQFLVLNPGKHGESTSIEMPTKEDLIALKAGMSAADILLPRTSESIGTL
jgi:predicted ATPase